MLKNSLILLGAVMVLMAMVPLGSVPWASPPTTILEESEGIVVLNQSATVDNLMVNPAGMVLSPVPNAEEDLMKALLNVVNISNTSIMAMVTGGNSTEFELWDNATVFMDENAVTLNADGNIFFGIDGQIVTMKDVDSACPVVVNHISDVHGAMNNDVAEMAINSLVMVNSLSGYEANSLVANKLRQEDDTYETAEVFGVIKRCDLAGVYFYSFAHELTTATNDRTLTAMTAKVREAKNDQGAELTGWAEVFLINVTENEKNYGAKTATGADATTMLTMILGETAEKRC